MLRPIQSTPGHGEHREREESGGVALELQKLGLEGIVRLTRVWQTAPHDNQKDQLRGVALPSLLPQLS